MTKSKWDQERRDAEYKHKINKVLQERCKHGMKFEYCATCNEIEYFQDVKIYVQIKDKVTGEPRTVPVTHQDVRRIKYKRWR